MDIKDVRKEKEILKDKILEAVTQFEANTEIPVFGINLYVVDTRYTNEIRHSINIDVRL